MTLPKNPLVSFFFYYENFNCVLVKRLSCCFFHYGLHFCLTKMLVQAAVTQMGLVAVL